MGKFTLTFSKNDSIIPEVPGVKPLTLRNVGTNSANVSIEKFGSPTINGLQYRMEGEKGWLPYTIGTQIIVNANKAVQFQNTNEMLNIGENDHVYFVIPDGTKFNAEGNLQSMLNYSDSVSDYCFYDLFISCIGLTDASQLELPATTLADWCYGGMFYRCKSLTTAPELPATTLAGWCYSSMFHHCTSLTTAPELPATTLAEGCYSSMFYICTSLTTAPELPATTLAEECYSSMFNSCTSLTTAPELPATTLAINCYSGMFCFCTSLNYVKVGLTEWFSTGTSYWLTNVSSTGTFYKPSALPEEFGINRIPTGWTVVNFDEILDSESDDD